MFDKIYLETEKFKDYKTLDNKPWLTNFSNINIFIGSNNSGKSRFTRSFFSDRELQFFVKDIDISEINKIVKSFKNEIYSFYSNQINGDYGNVKSQLDEMKEIEFLYIGFSAKDAIYSHLDFVKNVSPNLAIRSTTSSSYVAQYLKEAVERCIDKLNPFIKQDFKIPNLKNIYIPTLRGLRELSKETDSYLNRTYNDYFSKTDVNKVDIYTGLSLYDDTKKLLLGDKKDRDIVRAFESFLSEVFFDNREVNIIPRINEDVVYVRIGSEEYPIFSLGDGIQSIIILTYPLFFNKGKELTVFIEEPEHFLHPGYQRVFLETLLRKEFKKFQFFITTHSNHFLDITLDVDHVSVYTFKKVNLNNQEPSFTIENVENENSDILEIIGVRNSSVFLSNCTIWVEGITDRIYLRKYLDMHQKNSEIKFKEDMHYSFVEYGGGNITHWSFLKSNDCKHPNIEVERLCGKLFLISDKDGTVLNKGGALSKKAERHAELKSTLGDRYYCLQCREMENALSPVVLKKVIEEYEGDNRSKLVFSKKFNEVDNYKDSYIGKYIEKYVSNITRKYSDKSGTINDKVNFAKKAVSFMKTEADMSEEAIKLTKRLFDFIKDNNK